MLINFFLVSFLIVSAPFLFLFPFILGISKSTRSLKVYPKIRLHYISSLEKQNAIINCSTVKYVTPVKKKKKQFILLKTNNNDLTINICRLKKNKTYKRDSQFDLLHSRETEYLCHDKNETVKKEENDKESEKQNKKENEKSNIIIRRNGNESGNKKKHRNANRNEKEKVLTEIEKSFSSNNDDNTIDKEISHGKRKENKNNIQSHRSYENSGRNYNNGNYDDGNDDDGDNDGRDDNEDKDFDENETNEETDEIIEKELRMKGDYEKKYNKKKEKETVMEMEDTPSAITEKTKQKLLDEYRSLVELLKNSKEKKMREMKENEEKGTYEYNERIINSSQKWNLENFKKEIERNFKPNAAVEQKIQDYMLMFTQNVQKEETIENNKNNYISTNLAENYSNNSVDDTDFITEEEENENLKILKKMNEGDYSDANKFHFKLSKNDFERMKNLQEGLVPYEKSNEEENLNGKKDEEKKLIDELFLKIQNDENDVLGKLREKERQILEFYKKKREEKKIERNEELENMIYYNKKIDETMEWKKQQSESKKEDTNANSILQQNIFYDEKNRKTNTNNSMFFSTDEKFVFIDAKKIQNMSEAQIRDELRKRNYPTFGSLDDIRNRLLLVMKVKENYRMNIKNILRNPHEHVMSSIKLDKLQKTVKTYKEMDACGDTESKLKQIDAAIEISKFLKDPTHYLRIDTFDKLAKAHKNHSPVSKIYEQKEQEDISKEPIINDYNFDKEIAIAENLKKTFNLDSEEKQPEGITYMDAEEPNQDNDEIEEMNRKEILKYGSLEETVFEFHEKHDLSLDFIGDFICKFTDVDIEEINKYKVLKKEEIQDYSINDLDQLLTSLSSSSSTSSTSTSSTSTSSTSSTSTSSSVSPSFSSSQYNNHYVNPNETVIVPKFVDIDELISKYLSTKHIVTLIEYANIADPVDVIQYYSPENLHMLSEEYGLPIQVLIDACTRLNIKLPFGGDTRLNKECFNALTVYINKQKKVHKRK